jgi:hypothetical protein
MVPGSKRRNPTAGHLIQVRQLPPHQPPYYRQLRMTSLQAIHPQFCRETTLFTLHREAPQVIIERPCFYTRTQAHHNRSATTETGPRRMGTARMVPMYAPLSRTKPKRRLNSPSLVSCGINMAPIIRARVLFVLGRKPNSFCVLTLPHSSISPHPTPRVRVYIHRPLEWPFSHLAIGFAFTHIL